MPSWRGTLQEIDEQIQLLQDEIIRYKARELPIADISSELHAQHGGVNEFTLLRNPIVNMDSMRIDTVTFAYVQYARRPDRKEAARLEEWLKARTKADSLKLVIQVER